MQERTRILGSELVAALERADAALEAHDRGKAHLWLSQDWREHAARAIVHLGNALLNNEDGTEIEAAHGAVRALMALTKIVSDEKVKHLSCSTHVGDRAVSESRVEQMSRIRETLAQYQPPASIQCPTPFDECD